MKNIKQKKGITLIALVITIIVMLILVAVTINMVVNGGLFGYAGSAVSQTKTARDDELNATNIESGLSTDQLIAKFTSQSVTNPYASETPAYTWACDTSGNWSEATGSETSGILAKAYAKGTVTPTGGTESTAYHLVIEPVAETGMMGSLILSNKQDESYKIASESNMLVDVKPFLLAVQQSSPQAWLASRYSVREYITKVIICDGITNIGNKAFLNCSSLENVIISKSITSIEMEAFEWCTILTRLSYKGTRDEWNNITKHIEWNFHSHINAIDCSDGVINLSE